MVLVHYRELLVFGNLGQASSGNRCTWIRLSCEVKASVVDRAHRCTEDMANASIINRRRCDDDTRRQSMLIDGVGRRARAVRATARRRVGDGWADFRQGWVSRKLVRPPAQKCNYTGGSSVNRGRAVQLTSQRRWGRSERLAVANTTDNSRYRRWSSRFERCCAQSDG